MVKKWQFLYISQNFSFFTRAAPIYATGVNFNELGRLNCLSFSILNWEILIILGGPNQFLGSQRCSWLMTDVVS